MFKERGSGGGNHGRSVHKATASHLPSRANPLTPQHSNGRFLTAALHWGSGPQQTSTASWHSGPPDATLGRSAPQETRPPDLRGIKVGHARTTMLQGPPHTLRAGAR